MSRLVAALAVLALAAPGAASAFTKQERSITMSDGVQIAATYYVPDGAPPPGGRPAVMLFHGLGGSRTTPTPLGVSLNSLAESQLVPQGYAVLTFDARGHGQSQGLVSIDGPREIQDVRELFDWLAAQSGVDGQRIGAFGFSYGGGAIWNATAQGVPFAAIEVANTWTDLYSALLPQDLARSGVLLGFWQSIQARAAPGLQSIVDDAIAGRNFAGLHTFAGERSVRARLGSIRAPAFLLQGRRDFAFDLDQALTAYSRLKVPKRLYVADFGHPPAPNPPAEAAHVLPEVRAWFDRYLNGLPNGIDKQPPIEVAYDPWTGRTSHFKTLPRRKMMRLAFSGRSAIGSTGKVARTRPRLRTRPETFGAPVVHVSLASPNGWPQVVAVLSAFTPQHKELVVSAGGARVHLAAKPKRVAIRLVSQATTIPKGSRLRLTIAATSTAQSSSNLLYFTGIPPGRRLLVGPASLSVPVLAKPISR
jgi:predicted acyl esterase